MIIERMHSNARRKTAGCETHSEPLERLRLHSVYLELYEVEGRQKCVAIVERKTSQLSPRTWRTLECLESAGLAVRIRVFGY